MARELPKKPYRNVRISNYDINFYNSNTVNILLDNSPLNEALLRALLSSYKNITFQNITSVDCFNSLISFISNSVTDNNILIDILSNVDKDVNNKSSKNVIEGLENNIYMNLESIPDNVKIKAFNSNNSQTEFTTWAHNLNSKDKHSLLKVLCEEDQFRFIEQEKVIVDFYNVMAINYPYVFSMNDMDKFNFIFDYVSNNFPYSSEATDRKGRSVKPDYKWSQDAIETYKRGRGVCEGRANLLTLVTNNSYMNLNCVTVEGYTGDIGHSWNQFINNGNITDYDLSYNYKNKSMVEMRKEKSRSYERVYPKVFTWITNQCKKKILRPLPKDE